MRINRLLGILLCALSVNAAAQSYPSKAVRMVVAWPPGGGADIMARILADPLSRVLGQQILVDNRGGSNGIIGAELIARAAGRCHHRDRRDDRPESLSAAHALRRAH